MAFFVFIWYTIESKFTYLIVKEAIILGKKCKTCGAPLNSDRCDYCGRNHGEAVDTPAFHQSAPTNDIPTTNMADFGFDTDSSTSTDFSYNHGSNDGYGGYGYTPPRKKSYLGLILGISGAVVLVMVAIFLFFFMNRFVPYGTHEESALIGSWDNGRGPVFLWVFDEPDAVTFLDNGIVRIYQNNRVQSVDWEPGANGTFRADGRRFRYEITGQGLIITDSFNDSWTFNQAGEVATQQTSNANEAIMSGQQSSDENEAHAAIQIQDLVGRWNWSQSRRAYYRFNDDGTGYRNFVGVQNFGDAEHFYWTIVNGDELHIRLDGVAFFGVDFEMWRIELIDDAITLESLQGGGTFTYNRN